MWKEEIILHPLRLGTDTPVSSARREKGDDAVRGVSGVPVDASACLLGMAALYQQSSLFSQSCAAFFFLLSCAVHSPEKIRY